MGTNNRKQSGLDIEALNAKMNALDQKAEKWVNREDSILAIYCQNPEAGSTEIEVFRAYILLDRAKICQARGQKDQAERYYAEYTQTARGKEIQGYLFGGHYLMQAHRYADAADVYQQLDHYLGSYGFDYNLEIIGDELIPKFNANYYAGRKDSALQVALKIAEVYDSALVMQKRSDAANLATLYDVQGKERQIVEQVSQASGFTSADTFTRNFRAKYGMTPTAYRQTKT